jgi:hypothetical protein
MRPIEDGDGVAILLCCSSFDRRVMKTIFFEEMVDDVVAVEKAELTYV